MRPVNAIIHTGEKFFVGECLEFDVITQGETGEETKKNLREALALYFENKDPESFFIHFQET